MVYIHDGKNVARVTEAEATRLVDAWHVDPKAVTWRGRQCYFTGNVLVALRAIDPDARKSFVITSAREDYCHECRSWTYPFTLDVDYREICDACYPDWREARAEEQAERDAR